MRQKKIVCHGSFALIGGSCAQFLSFGADWRSTENLDSATYRSLSIDLFSVARYYFCFDLFVRNWVTVKCELTSFIQDAAKLIHLLSVSYQYTINLCSVDFQWLPLQASAYWWFWCWQVMPSPEICGMGCFSFVSLWSYYFIMLWHKIHQFSCSSQCQCMMHINVMWWKTESVVICHFSAECRLLANIYWWLNSKLFGETLSLTMKAYHGIMLACICTGFL